MYKLLIADDDEIICDGLSKCIPWQENGIVITASVFDGAEAFEQIEKHKPDVVIADINMPFLDGISLAKKVKERFPEIQIILLTAYREFEYAKRAIQLQVFEYITKPFTNEEVLQAVLKAVARIEENGKYSDPDRISWDRIKKNIRESQGKNKKAIDKIFDIKKELTEGVNYRDQSKVEAAKKALIKEIELLNKRELLVMNSVILEFFRSAWEATDDEKEYENYLVSSGGLMAEFLASSDQKEVIRIVEDSFQKLMDYISSKSISDIECRVRMAVSYMEENYPDPNLSLNDVAAAVNLSTSYLANSMKKYLEISYSNLLNKIRLDHAKQLLLQQNIKTYEVAFFVGFNSSQYFSICFKKYTGLTPGMFREIYIKK